MAKIEMAKYIHLQMWKSFDISISSSNVYFLAWVIIVAKRSSTYYKSWY